MTVRSVHWFLLTMIYSAGPFNVLLAYRDPLHLQVTLTASALFMYLINQHLWYFDCVAIAHTSMKKIIVIHIFLLTDCISR